MTELLNYEKSPRFAAREKLALRYADAIMFDPAQADDTLWAALHGEFVDSRFERYFSLMGTLSPWLANGQPRENSLTLRAKTNPRSSIKSPEIVPCAAPVSEVAAAAKTK